MRYEKQILEAYTRLGFSPRDRQVEYINKILVAFLDEECKNVILSAPTGTGKSIIGAVVADALHRIKYPERHAGASFLLTATNVLAHQYHDSFVDDDAPFEADPIFHMVKGAGNYACEALSTPEEPQTAEQCSIIMFTKQGLDSIINQYCDNCEYRISRKLRDRARHLITNYAYFFIDRMYATHPMEKRTVTVFDEAHLLNDLFVEHNAIYFSEKRFEQFAEEISEELGVNASSSFYKDLKDFKLAIAAGRITDQNYKEYLQALLTLYTEISDHAKMIAARHLGDHKKYTKLMKLSKKYFNLGCKIDDLFIFDYPHVFEYKKKDPKKGQNDNECSVKPIFIGDMFGVLDNADHNLLMSATISEKYAKRTMTLPGKTLHLRLPPQFPKENKKVLFFKTQTLNYNTMKDPETIKRLCATAWQIVDHHVKKGERGIILAPSFAIVESIAGTLHSMGGVKVFEHKRGEKLADILEDFKSYKGGKAVILTPSGFEGVDLPGDLSRFQIIVKAPFGSLGDKRIEHILNIFPDIYSLGALMKIVQGAGRSVRSNTDYATTYMLDTAISRLWSKDNEWADEFTTSFTTVLPD